MSNRDLPIDRPEDRVVSLRALEAPEPPVSDFLAAVESAYVQPIPEAVASAHLAAILAAAGEQGPTVVLKTTAPAARRRFRALVVLAAAFSAVFIVAGLSFAGVITWSPPPAHRAPQVQQQTPQTGGGQVEVTNQPARTDGGSMATNVQDPTTVDAPQASGGQHGKPEHGDSAGKPGKDADEGNEDGDNPDNPANEDCAPLGGSLHNCVPK